MGLVRSDTLQLLSTQRQVILLWVPGNSGYLGNEMVRVSSSTSFMGLQPSVTTKCPSLSLQLTLPHRPMEGQKVR